MEKEHSRSTPPQVHDLVVLRAIQLFEAKPNQEFTLSKLATLLGVSRPALGRRFQAALQKSPLRVLREIRMEKAAALLLSSDAGLAAVAAEVGYESEFALSRAFFKHFDMRPGQYRKGNSGPIRMCA